MNYVLEKDAQYKSLLSVIWRAGRKDVFLGIPWVPVYAVAELSIAFVETLLLQLIFIETPRVGIAQLVPQQARKFLDFGGTIDRKELFYALPMLIVVFGALKLMANFSSTYFIERSGHRVAHSLRHKLLAGFLGSIGNELDKKNPDETANQILYDTSVLQNTIGKGLLSSVRDMLVVLGCIASIFFLAFKIALIAALVLAPIFFLVGLATKRLQVFSVESAKRQVDLSTRILQTRNGLLPISGLRTQDRELIDLEGRSQSYFNFVRKFFLIRTVFRPGMEFLAVALVAGVLFWRFQLGTGFEAAAWSGLFIFVAVLFRPLKNVAGFAAQWNEISVVYQRLQNQWKSYAVACSAHSAERSTPKHGFALQVSDLTYEAHGGRVILDNCSMEVPRGLRVALVGSSGSGKTTFLRLCAGLLSQTRGRVAIDSQFLLATQSPYIFRGTVFDNIIYNGLLGNIEVQTSKIRDLILNLSLAFSEVGADIVTKKKLGFLGEGLSGGERARVALARVLAKEPKLLLLDEPTANLDAESADLFWKSVAEWKARSSENTVVVVLHVMRDPSAWDVCYVFDEGRIVSKVNPSEAHLVLGK